MEKFTAQKNIFGGIDKIEIEAPKVKEFKKAYFDPSHLDLPIVGSLSGGKTSSYMEVHYPSDYPIFSLVCIDDPKCGHPDKKVMQIINDKFEKSGSLMQWGEFVGTCENIKTVDVMLALEQKIGREIHWVRWHSFDELILDIKKHIPNEAKRFCSWALKVYPIFWYLYIRDLLPCSMRIGFRASEPERAESFSDEIKVALRSEYRPKSKTWINRWTDFKDWRVGDFVLIRDNIFHHTIREWAKNSGIQFPEDDNCQMCYWKEEQQLRKNWDDSPNVMNWARDIEIKMEQRWKKSLDLEEIKALKIQLGFNFGTGAGCRAGWCTS